MDLDFLYEYMEIKKNLQRKVPIFDAIYNGSVKSDTF